MHPISLDELRLAEQNAGGLEMIRYEHFYRQHGARKFGEFVVPRLSEIERFMLPLEAVVHYLPSGSSEVGIPTSHLFIRNSETYVMIQHVEELQGTAGNPLRTPVQVNQLTQQYRKQARRVRPLRNWESTLRNERTVPVINYAMLSHLYRYHKNAMMTHSRNMNILTQFVFEANAMAERSDRQQYLLLSMPKSIPTPATFKAASRSFTRRFVTLFGDLESLFLLELWKWLGAERETSVFAGLSDKAVAALQFVFTETGRYSIVQMYKLNGWRGVEGNTQDSDRKVKPLALQVALVKFGESMLAVRTATDKVVITEQDGVVTVDDTAEEEALVRELEDDSVEVNDFEDNDDGETIVRYPELDLDVIEPPVDTETALENSIDVKTDEAVDKGMMSTAEKRRMMKLTANFKALKNPLDPKGTKTLVEAIAEASTAIDVLPEKVIRDSAFVLDKSLLNSTLKHFDSDYIDKVLTADIMAVATNIQAAGYVVTDYRIDRIEDIDNDYEMHSVQYTPVSGGTSTLKFKVPKIKPDGTYLAAGTRYRLRKQRTELPIVKTSPEQVALTSYYSKVFVSRSSKKVHNYPDWLIRQVRVMAGEGLITKVGYDDVFDNEVILPRTYTSLATTFSKFTANGIDFNFDLKFWRERLDEKEFNALVAEGGMAVGIKDGVVWYVNSDNGVYPKGELDAARPLEEVIGINVVTAPVDQAVVKILGKTIPVGFMLAYYLGFSNLLKALNVPFREVARGTGLNLLDDEYAIKFLDQSVVLSREYGKAALILSGMNGFHKSIAKYTRAEFDTPDVYGAVLDDAEIGARYLKELELLKELWVDPITKDVLAKMGEPTQWIKLLFRAIGLIATDAHPRVGDGTTRRIRGYERVAGHVYSELVRSVRAQKRRPSTSKSRLELHPNAVWESLSQDSALGIVNEINPIEELKELELLTFSGTGGRSARTMVRSTREFDRDDMGITSEATVDSSNVAITVYAPPNPKLSNLRGMRQDYQIEDLEPASLISTSALISPMSTHDDPKRTNFVNIQQSHTLAAVGYGISPLMTGAEETIAHRTSDLYSYVAKADGVLESVKADHIVVSYNDATLPAEHVFIGRRYGVSTGHTIPHDLVCDVAEKTKFKAGDVLVFNKGFFQRNMLNPTQVLWKTGAMANIATMDTSDTFEDSSALSAEFAEKLAVVDTHKKTIVIEANQGIHDLVRIGDSIAVDDILCNIEDAVSASGDLYDADTRETLRFIARNTPRSKFAGRIGKIEVKYNADLEDMSDTVKALVASYDKTRAKQLMSLGKPAKSGLVKGLPMDTVQIDIYIDHHLGFGDGDKLVVGNQLKSIARRVLTGVNKTESGIPIDVIFGYQSISDRIVTSAEGAGTTNVLVELAGQRACAAYRK